MIGVNPILIRNNSLILKIKTCKEPWHIILFFLLNTQLSFHCRSIPIFLFCPRTFCFSLQSSIYFLSQNSHMSTRKYIKMLLHTSGWWFIAFLLFKVLCLWSVWKQLDPLAQHIKCLSSLCYSSLYKGHKLQEQVNSKQQNKEQKEWRCKHTFHFREMKEGAWIIWTMIPGNSNVSKHRITCCVKYTQSFFSQFPFLYMLFSSVIL